MNRSIIKKTLSALIAAAVVATSVAVPAPFTTTYAEAAVKKSVSINYSALTIKKGTSKTLKATVKGTKKKTLVWTSSKPATVSVSKKGVVKGLKKGSAVITVNVKGTKLKDTVKVTVGTPVTKVSLYDSACEMKIGDTFEVGYKVTPKKASNKKVSFSSADKSVATVDSKGTITAVGVGSTTVTVKAKDGSGKKAAISVMVKDNKPVEAPATAPAVAPTTAPAVTSPAAVTPAATTPSTTTEDPYWWNHSGTNSGSNTSSSTPVFRENVASQSDLKESLAAAKGLSDAKTITLSTEANTKFTIAEDTYSNVTLVIDAKNADVENHAKFAKIVIKNIASDTFTEYGSDNTIEVQADGSHIKALGSRTVVNVATANISLRLDVASNTSLSSVNLSAAARLTITAASTSTGSLIVPVVVNAAGATVTTSVPVNFTSNAENTTLNVTTTDAAARTTISAGTTAQIPAINGNGSYAITTNDGNSEIVIARSNETTGQGSTVGTGTFSSSVTRTGSAAASDLTDTFAYLYQYGSDTVYKTVAVNPDGSFSLTDIPYGFYKLVIRQGTYEVTYIVEISESGDAANPTSITLVEYNGGTELASLSGYVTNARNGENIEGATVKLFEGGNNVYSTAVRTTTTAYAEVRSNGAVVSSGARYEFTGLTPGLYTVQVIKEGYTVFRGTVALAGGAEVLPIALSTNMAYGGTTNDGRIRFILTWTAYDENMPDNGNMSDLDSHLVGPSADGGLFHIYFSDQTYSVGSLYDSDDSYYLVDSNGHYNPNLYDYLDHDDTTYEGPETTTIVKLVNGVYHYYVHCYSNQDTSDNYTLSNSKARVDVYSGNNLLATFTITPNQQGNIWEVCTYDSNTGRLEKVDKMYYTDNYDATPIPLTPAQ